MNAMKVFYDERYVGSEHEFDTTKKAEDIAAALEDMTGVELVAPLKATLDELVLAHDESYVKAVLTGKGEGRSSAGFPWDPGYAEATATSTGGVLEAALAALRDGVSGSLSSGLHHAWSEGGTGFCTFNGLAVAAKMVLEASRSPRMKGVTPAERVLVLDLDAHCGGGTYDIVKHQAGIHQLDISVCTFDSYKPYDDRHRLRIVEKAKEYLPTLEEELGRSEDYDLVLYNAGMDPHEDCNVGGLAGITSDVIARREELVFEWARSRGIPVAFVLAGGYTGRDMWPEKLTALHTLTAAAAIGAPLPDVEEVPRPAEVVELIETSWGTVAEDEWGDREWVF